MNALTRRWRRLARMGLSGLRGLPIRLSRLRPLGFRSGVRRPSGAASILRRYEYSPGRRGVRIRRRRHFSFRAAVAWAVVVLSAMFGWSLWRGDKAPGAQAPVIAVWNARAASVHEFSLEEYIHGVVAAEMPASFHP